MTTDDVLAICRQVFTDAELNHGGHKGLPRVLVPYGNGFGSYIYPSAFYLIPAAVVLGLIQKAKIRHRKINSYFY